MEDDLLRDLGPHLSAVADRDAIPAIDQRVLDLVEAVSAMRRHAVKAFAGTLANTGARALTKSRNPKFRIHIQDS